MSSGGRVIPRCLLPAATALLLACGGGAAPPGAATPEWLAQLPAQEVTIAVGGSAWAAVPVGGGRTVRLGVYTVSAVDGDRASLRDAIGVPYEGVPGALIHPLVGDPTSLAAGSVVLGDGVTAHAVVGRLAAVDGGEVQLTYDWNGVTLRRPVAVVTPLPRGDGALPMTWVVYPGAGGAPYRGLCLAAAAERAWILDDAGFVRPLDRRQVRPLTELGATDFAPGAAVRVYSWARGFEAGVVVAALEPGLRYAVRVGEEVRPSFFTDLLSASTPLLP